MSGPFVAEFSFLLDSGKDGIEVEASSPRTSCYSLHIVPKPLSESSNVPFIPSYLLLSQSMRSDILFKVSYNAAGVLSHLASDGPFAWTISQPSREHVLERLVRAVTR